MNNIRIVFYCERRFFISRFILWVTGLWTSNVALMYWDEDWKRHMAMKATSGGLRLFSFEKFEKYFDIGSIIEPKHSLERGLSDMVGYLGTDLENAGLFGLTGLSFLRWLKKKWKAPFLSGDAMFNSEVVALVCVWSNYPGTLIFNTDTITPQDLFEFFIRER